jgi:hypothetical protein
MIELTLISLTIKTHPKHDPSADMTMPVCPSGEKMIQFNRRLTLISRRSFRIDQLIVPYAIFEPTNPSTVQL